MELLVKDHDDFFPESHKIQTVSSDEFIERMEKHWTQTLGNVSSHALRSTWKQIVDTFNYHIVNHDIPERAKEWSILSPPTGSGKTQSMILYASMLSAYPNDQHPAILIVTQRKADCDEIIRQINRLGVRETAIAYHGDTKKDIRLSDLESYPVVVITHSGYQKALDYLGHENFKSQTWSYFLSYNRNGKLAESLQGQFSNSTPFDSDNQSSSRRLVCIDESLDIVDHYMVTLKSLKNLKNMLEPEVKTKFADELALIDHMLYVMQTLENNNKKLKKSDPKAIISDRMVVRDSLSSKMPKGSTFKPDFSGLIAEIKGINPDQVMGISCPSLNDPVRKQLEQTLRSLQQIYTNWVYFANLGKDNNGLHSSKLIVPEGLKGCVVMDATASTSIIYDIHKDSVRLAPPKGSRDYSNVKLHVSMDHKVGKTHLTNEYNADRYAQQLIGDLNNRVSGRKTLIVCHKGIEDHINSYPSTFERYTGHWGELDGSNEFRDCDSVVIFGLNFRPKTWSPNVFFATQGIPKSDAWFNDKDERNFKDFEDIRRDLENSQLSVDIIQAINRVRCRKTVDSIGNCEPTDVYILLPHGEQGRTILKHIMDAMPKIKVDFDFNYDAVKRNVKRSEHERGLCMFLKNKGAGEYHKDSICRRLKMGTRTFERLVAKANEDPKCLLARTMVEHNITYHVVGHGRGAKSFFLKQ